MGTKEGLQVQVSAREGFCGVGLASTDVWVLGCCSARCQALYSSITHSCTWTHRTPALTPSYQHTRSPHTHTPHPHTQTHKHAGKVLCSSPLAPHQTQRASSMQLRHTCPRCTWADPPLRSCRTAWCNWCLAHTSLCLTRSEMLLHYFTQCYLTVYIHVV